MQKQKVDPIHLLWTTHEKFQRQVGKFRTKYNFNPCVGLMEFEVIRNIGWNEEKRNDFLRNIFELVFEYKLYGWEEELQYFIGTGDFPPQPYITPPNILKSKEGIQIAFTIKRPITKTQLKEWLEDNWLNGVKLNKITRQYFIAPQPAQEKHVKDFTIIQRIIELRDKEHEEFHDIADKIVKEFQINDSKGKINENSVKDLYHKYKNYVKSLKKRNLGISLDMLT